MSSCTTKESTKTLQEAVPQIFRMAKRLSTTSLLYDSDVKVATVDSLPECMRHDFIWKYGGTKITLTGSFDNWTKSMPMQWDEKLEVFRASVYLNPYTTWTFKFVVDGVWRCSLDFPTATDEDGNVNNVFYAASHSVPQSKSA